MLKKLFLFLPLMAVFLSGCNYSSDEIISRELEMDNFSQLKLELYADVEIEQGDKYSVIVEAPEKMFDELELNVEDDVLSVKSQRWLTSSDDLKIKVISPVIESIYATHNTNVHVLNLKTEDLYLSLSENAQIKAENLEITNAVLALVQKSQAEISGICENFDLKLQNESLFNGENFLVQNMSVDHNVGDDVEVQVMTKLVAIIRAEGGVKQKGVAEIDAQFLFGEDSGQIKNYNGEILYQLCNNYDSENCPETCKVCPPCPTCSSLMCQSKQACENLGFLE